MGVNHILSRQEACKYLGINEKATEEEIKKAYRFMVKQYHPDVNAQADTREIYIKIQAAYEYLLTHPYTVPIVRQPRIFQTDAQVREQYRKQKHFEEERKKALMREKTAKKQERKNAAPAQTSKSRIKSETKEEEVLEKIRAIWIAETIKRQIELDKEKKEAENRRKLYQAFMQQRINEEEEQKQG